MGFTQRKLSPEAEVARQAVHDALEALHVQMWKDVQLPTDQTVLMGWTSVAHFREIDENEDVVDLYVTMSHRGCAVHEHGALMDAGQRMIEEVLDAGL